MNIDFKVSSLLISESDIIDLVLDIVGDSGIGPTGATGPIGPQSMSDGTSTEPGLSFVFDNNTGLFRDLNLEWQTASVDILSEDPCTISEIAWGPEVGLFAFGGDDATCGLIYTSSDGLSWTSQVEVSSSVGTIVWAPELTKFVAISFNAAIIGESGTTWTTYAGPAAISDLTWAPELSLFVAIGGSGSAVSVDGITWTTKSEPDGRWKAIVWAPELSYFVAVGSFIFPEDKQITISPDGINWTTYIVGTLSLNDITWSSELGLLVAVCSGGEILTSSDAITWTTRDSGHSNRISSIVWAPELHLFRTTGSLPVQSYSFDGINWITETSSSRNTIVWAPELTRFLAGGTNVVNLSYNDIFTIFGASVDSDTKLQLTSNFINLQAPLVGTITSSSGPGAVSISGNIHEITTTGIGDALTLADGTPGQFLTITYVSESAGTDTAILTPTTLSGATTITFNTIGDTVCLVFGSVGGWYISGSNGVVIA